MSATHIHEELAHFCKSAADVLRVAVLRILHHDSFSVQELCQIFGLKQSAMSHHLKVLYASQLVTTRREGNTIYYRRRVFSHDHPLAALQVALFETLDRSPPESSVAAGIREVEKQREHSSRTFFLDNADKFRAQQDLIARFDHYAEGVQALLGTIPLPSRKQAVEIGPGDGLFLPTLARLFDSVAAFDTSSAMVRSARELVQKAQLGHVTVHLGDIRTALAQLRNVDCVVINMVLHHVATPVEIFHDIGKLLAPGGALVVTDLCHHDQSWAKEACGDIWQGFDPDDLTAWAKHANLAEGQSSYLALRNGFRIQIRHFQKPVSTFP
jgi:DNA-binding transcriptional ArsR family regulator